MSKSEAILATNFREIKLKFKKGLIALSLALLFASIRSLIDYLGLMYFPSQIGNDIALFSGVLFNLGLIASIISGFAKRSWKSFVYSIPIFGLGTYLSENTFYVWLNILGDRTSYYQWFAGNPLNPDGNFGYGGTCNVPFFGSLNMAGYALLIGAYYGTIFLVLALASPIFTGKQSTKIRAK